MGEHESLAPTVNVTERDDTTCITKSETNGIETAPTGPNKDNGDGRSPVLKPPVDKARSHSRKSKRKVTVKVPSVEEKSENDDKVFQKASVGLRNHLEGIKEDCDEDKGSNNRVEQSLDISGKPLSDNACISLTQLANTPAFQGNINGNDTVGAKERSNKKDQSKMFPTPLVRSSTDGSIRLKKLVTEDRFVERDSRRKSACLPSVFTRPHTEMSLATTHNDATSPVSARSRPSTSGRKTKRSKSVAGWSKKELEIFLPRKTFFSTHDNTLSQAGFDTRSDEERKRPEWRKYLRMRTTEELFPPEPKKEEPPPLSSFAIVEDDDEEEEEYSLENIVTSLSADGDKDTSHTKRKWRHNAKKSLSNDKEEYKPLYDYIKHIHDNPEEYIQMAKFNPKNLDYKHPNRLVRMGRAFRRGHHGTPKNNMYLHALADIKQTCPDVPNQKPGIKKDSHEMPETTANSDETEIEKLKAKAEKWIKGQTTQQILRAKDLVLKDIGEEDITFSKWWIAFKSCKYIRVLHPTDTGIA